MLPVYEPSIGKLEEKYIVECVRSAWISSSGKMVKEFGDKFKKFLGTRYAIPVSSGTAALHLALLAHGIGPGDQVICPAFTFAATANAVYHAGARPVLVDINHYNLSLDVEEVEKAITPKTKAVMVAHLYGMPADMKSLKRLCKKRKLLLIEDAAESLGAIADNHYVGSIGDIGCFSFYGNKNITTGEGGMVVTNSKKIAEKITYFASHAMKPSKRYWHDEIGYNYRMTSLQAAIGAAQMDRIDELLQRKIHIANTYDKLLKNQNNIKLMKHPPYGSYVCWLYTIFCDNKKVRDRLAKYLDEHLIETRKTFYALSDMPPYYSKKSFPVSKAVSETGLSLPSSPSLKDSDIRYIAKTLHNFFDTYAS